MIRSVAFFSKKAAESFRPPVRAVLVSITDPGDSCPVLAGQYAGLVRLSFHDRLGSPADFAPGSEADPFLRADLWRVRQYERAGYSPRVWTLFSPEQAAYLASVLVRLHDNPLPFSVYVHCFAGKSRSAAISVVTALFAGIPLPDRIERANDRVLFLLGRSLGLPDTVLTPFGHSHSFLSRRSAS